jgi:carnosine N-methyltransferase
LADFRAEIRVLVPGAGLGRIVYEVLRAGFEVQGNELEFCMLMASNLALNELSPKLSSNNRLHPDNPYELYPYIHTMSHHRSTEDLLRKVLVPDEYPAQGMLLSGTKGQMSMVAGDFVDCYSSPAESQTFSVVITVFFIDTAANVLRYIDTIYNVLEPNGAWINLGPLAWHFESDGEDSAIPHSGKEGGSVELTLDELTSLIKKYGFTLETGQSLSIKSLKMPYMANSKAMLTYLYETEFWVARKKV